MALSGMAVASSDTGGSRPDGTVTSAAAHKSDGKEQATPSWVKPVSGDYELSASFGNSGDRWASTHSGQDFAVPIGTDVQAVHGGTVVKAGGNGAGDGPAYGNAIVIKHTDGLYTQYAHLSEIDVTVGQQVSTGDMIGLSGNTGNSSGPHLHFEVRTTPDYGSAVDPVAFLRGEDVTV
ncbi:M23 family metallopeptidase [Streptomyces sp. RFCAC02]|uniref:M23 family metallopeptidase n=1 Tax=Streptomyces sp. RFCAC02 TaxID=2499143 RepID=UPI001020DB41|nr:M23 family metallopeptidase [Streptomyces sp. RFCAC02]